MEKELEQQILQTDPNMMEIDIEEEMQVNEPDSDIVPDEDIPQPRPNPTISPIDEEYDMIVANTLQHIVDHVNNEV